MGKEISRFIESKDDKPETMMREVSKFVKKISKLNGFELDSFQIGSLTRNFLFKDEYEKFFVEKEDYYILPTVVLELWLYDNKYQSESS